MGGLSLLLMSSVPVVAYAEENSFRSTFADQANWTDANVYICTSTTAYGDLTVVFHGDSRVNSCPLDEFQPVTLDELKDWFRYSGTVDAGTLIMDGSDNFCRIQGNGPFPDGAPALYRLEWCQ